MVAGRKLSSEAHLESPCLASVKGSRPEVEQLSLIGREQRRRHLLVRCEGSCPSGTEREWSSVGVYAPRTASRHRVAPRWKALIIASVGGKPWTVVVAPEYAAVSIR